MEKHLQQKDRNFVWHPYTQMKDFEQRDLLLVDRAEGIYLYDHKGKRYYDTISSWWCVMHGHNHPLIKEAVKRQLDRLEQVHFAATTHEGAIRLAEYLVSITPPALSKVFFSDNGSTANEVALKMSFQYRIIHGDRQRQKFISLERGYHGDTIGTISLGGVPAFEGPFKPLTFDSFRIPAPYCYRCPMGCDAPDKSSWDQASEGPFSTLNCSLECLDPLSKLLSEQGGSITAMILEPLLMGAGGIIVYPAEYIRKAAKLCREHGVHLIFDEVATGFGRTGTMFALEQADVVPDFLCLSKGLTGGYLPLAATVTTDEIYNAFYADYSEGKTFFHGHTFTANPLGCAAALGSAQVFREEDVLSRLPSRILALQRGKKVMADLPHVGDVRGMGMAAAFELVRDKNTKEPFDPDMRIGWQVYLQGLENGLILRPLGDVTYLFPPLCTEPDAMEDILQRTETTLRQVFERL